MIALSINSLPRWTDSGREVGGEGGEGGEEGRDGEGNRREEGRRRRGMEVDLELG